MGCAGSKPHMIANGNHHGNLNSPQKGFILFNAKTIEYLIANEADTKQKLIQRCQPKLLKAPGITMSKSSSLSSGNSNGVKKNLLTAATMTTTMPEVKNDDTTTNNLDVTNTNTTAVVTPTTPNSNNNSSKHKEAAIDAAVDYVLKYAINDFDIEDFKSSNHLSMKQIRKDIMKKSSASRVSHSKLSNNSNGNMAAVTHDLAFYKLALNTAIDEFGSFVQENFIVINEFAAKLEEEEQQKAASATSTSVIKNGDIVPDGPSAESLDDEEALKLKEALEVARQNFYRGKVSMVCMAKHGGYVVKEVNDKDQATMTPTTTPTVSNHEDEIVMKTTTSLSLVNDARVDDSNEAKIVVGDKTPKINIEDFDHGTHLDDELQTSSSKVGQSSVPKMPIDEFLSIKNDLATVLTQTGEYIVSYSSKSAIYNESSHSNELEEENSKKLFDLAKSCGETLLENLEKSKNIIEILNIINEKDYNLIDEKLLESTLNLDYVNREFKAYLALLDDSLKQNREKFESSPKKAENYREIFDKNAEIKLCVMQLSTLIQSLPRQLFVSKGFPHPSDANHSLSITSLNTSDFSKDLEELILNREKNLATVTAITDAGKQDQDNDSRKSGATTTTTTVAPIDIKKEIAFSILNVGEVIAKTIDYYSLESNDTQSEDLKELIKLSDDQAALEKKEAGSRAQSKENLPTGLLHVSVDNNSNNNNVDDGFSKKEERKEQLQTPESSASSLSSPSLGGSASSPMSESGSVSPIITKSMHNNNNENNDDSMKVVSSPSSRHQDYDLIEKVKSTAFTEQVKPSSSKNSIQDDLAYLASELSMNTQLNGIENFDCSQIKNNDVNNYGNEENRLDHESDRAKSSSSSSDILSSNNDDLEILSNRNNQVNVEESSPQMIVEQFIEGIIENASDRYTNENESQDQSVVFRKQSQANDNEIDSKTEADNNKVKRMSLDEEIFYRLEEVDKKVKYMNETCSENEDDLDDLDDENFDYDESVEMDNGNDDRLFHPRTPAKIKSEVRQNRAIDLHEEIKQISNVIQDLVQTINVRNGSKSSINNEGLTDDDQFDGAIKINNINNNTITNGIHSSFEDNNNNADSEDGGSQNSGSGGDYISITNGNERRNSNNKRHSTGNNSSLSNIPIRKNSQKNTPNKQNTSLIQSDEVTNDKALTNDLIEEISIENTKTVVVASSPSDSTLNNNNNRKVTSQKSRSKLPVRK